MVRDAKKILTKRNITFSTESQFQCSNNYCIIKHASIFVRAILNISDCFPEMLRIISNRCDSPRYKTNIKLFIYIRSTFFSNRHVSDGNIIKFRKHLEMIAIGI